MDCVFATFVFEIPVTARIVMFECQRSIPTLWIQVDTEAPLVERWFRLYRTGATIHSKHPLTYVDSCISEMGETVYHCFEETHP
jgi:hypothetical protein